MEAAEVRSRHMASEVRVVAFGIGRTEVVVVVESRLEALESRWSRFRPESDITHLNRAGGAWVDVHPDTLRLLDTIRRATDLTDGAFDATVLPALLAAGYTHSVVDGSPAPALSVLSRPEVGRGSSTVEVDLAGRRARLGGDVVLDPGGIGKGLAADLLAEELVDLGASGVLVSVGGDLRTAGSSPTGTWTIPIEHPASRERTLATLGVDHGGIATSTTTARRFDRAGSVTHHVIDPRTGEPADSDLVSATVVAPTAWEAEALATASLVLGAAPAYELLAGCGGTGVLLTGQDACLVTPDLARTRIGASA